jgi:hypothetical protein
MGMASVVLYTSVMFPYYISRQININNMINAFNPDRRGGLSPVIELLFYARSIFSSSLVVSALLFPELHATQESFFPK